MCFDEISFVRHLQKKSIKEIKEYMNSIKEDLSKLNNDPNVIENRKIYTEYKVLLNKVKQDIKYKIELIEYLKKYDIELIKYELQEYFILENKLKLSKRALNNKCNLNRKKSK